MSFNLQKIGNPIFEACALTEVKEHMRVSLSSDDSYIGLLIQAAREMVEKDFNEKLVGQRYFLHLENGFFHYARFNPLIDSYYTFDVDFELHRYAKIQLPVQPVQSIAAINYTDTTGAPQTLSTENYQFRSYTDPPEIKLIGTLPAIQPGSEIIIDLTAGHTETADEDEDNPQTVLPQLYKNAIYLLVAHWYENREATIQATIVSLPLAYERIKQLSVVKRFR